MGDNFYQDEFTFFLVVQVSSQHYLRKKYSKICPVLKVTVHSYKLTMSFDKEFVRITQFLQNFSWISEIWTKL